MFFPDRVELCQVRVVSDSRAGTLRAILDILRAKLDSGRHQAFDGSTLARRVSCRGGQNGVARCIRDFRRTVAALRREELGLEVGDQDVVQSGGPGYRLNPWIVVRDGEQPGGGVGTDAGERVMAAPASEASGADDRRVWIVAELDKGRALRAPEIARALRCSPATAKRELVALKAEGRIVFEGAGRTGSYRLQQPA